MSTSKTCTPQEAVAIHRFAANGSDGPVMVLDLDAVVAALCIVEKGGAVKTLWSAPGNAPEISFFRALAREFAPDCDEQEAAAALYQATAAWNAALRLYTCYGAEDFALEPVQVGGRTIHLHCSEVSKLFRLQYLPQIRQMLGMAAVRGVQLQREGKLRLLPCGTLAAFYTAEYLIREIFYTPPQVKMPVLPGLMTWRIEELLRAKGLGSALHEKLSHQQSELEHTWTLKLLRRTAEGLQHDTQVLARKGTRPEQLQEVQYQEELLAVPGEELTVFIGSTAYKVPIPAALFGEEKFLRVQVGLGFDAGQPQLYLRSGKQETVLDRKEWKITGEAAT